jgi:hypothetical protein
VENNMKLFNRVLQILSGKDPVQEAAPIEERPRDRRRHPRHSVKSPAWLLLQGRRLSVRMDDVSLGGAQVLSRFEPNARIIDLELELDGRTVSIKAQVVRLDFQHGLYVIGAQFQDMTIEQQSFLQSFIEAQTRHHGIGAA